MSEHASAHRTTNSQSSVQAQPITAETETPSILGTRQLTPAGIMQLQRTVGNKAVQGMIQRMGNGPSVIQRAGGTTAQAAPVLTPEQQQRKTDMDTERDAKVPPLVDASLTGIKDKVTKNIDTYLTADSKADPVRKNVKAKVISEISGSMTRGTAEQRKDALKYAQESAEGIMINKLKEYAVEVVDGQFDTAKRNGMTAEANKAYDSVTPSLNDAAFEKQKTKSAADAQKKLNTLAKTVMTEAVTASKTVISAKFAAPTTPGGVSGFDRIDVKTVGTDELKKRIDLDDKLVDKTVVRQETVDGNIRNVKDMENIYETVLFNPMKQAVLSKLGVGRRAFRRSKELNKYREDLKKAAREKVNQQIDTEITGRQGTSSSIAPSSAPMKAEYMKMATKAMAYKESKKLVDDVMGNEADAILGRIIPKDPTIEEMSKLAKSSAYEVARNDQDAADKIRAAGVEAAEAYAKKILKENKDKAVLEARKLTKGTKKTATEAATAPDAAKTGQIKSDVQNDDKTKKLAKTVIDKSVEASDLNSGFNKVGKLIDISTPNAGDSSSMDIELKIPIASAAGGGTGYFLFGFGGEAEREAEDLTVNTQLTFGAGFTTFGFDANFRTGLFLEGKGKDTDSVMNLLSYGLYREMSNISPGAAGHFWGKGGRSGDSKLVEAEKWAMMIEEQNMDDASEVQVGSLTKLAMEANVGVASFSGELAQKRLSKYNKEIIEKKGKDAAGAALTAKQRVDNNSIGKGEVQKIDEAATEVEVGFGKDKVAFGLEGTRTRMKQMQGIKEVWIIRELGLQLSASIPSQFGEESGDFTQYAAKIVTAAVGGGKNITALFKKATAPEPDRAARAGGSALDAGSDALFTGNYFDSIGTSFAEKIQGDETINDTMRSWLPGEEAGASAIEQANKIALSNSLKLAVGFKREYDETGAPGDWEIAIEASQVKSQEVDAEIIKVAVEKSKRLGKLEFAKGKTTKYELLGLERGGEATPAAPTTP